MKKNSILASMLSVALILGFASGASANPSKADLKFKYRSNGSLAVDVKFDKPITGRCIARHRSSLYYEGDVLGDPGVIRRSTLSRSLNVGRKSTSLRATGLQGAEQKNGKDPILSVQVKLVCSKQADVTSNVEARFIRCGPGVKRVSLNKYLSNLKSKLAFSR